MRTFFSDKKTLSLRLCASSILLYSFWLLLPSAQTLGGAICGAASVALFALGILLDTDQWRAHWKLLILQAAFALIMPLILYVFLQRGNPNFLGFYVQNVMLWFPLIYASYALRKDDKRLWNQLYILLTVLITITTITTIIWNTESLFQPRIFETYSRMLGNGAIYPGNARVLMLLNTGGYDFIYAAVLALPLVFGLILNSTGKKRFFWSLLLFLLVIMMIICQYTYAILYTFVILLVEFTALFLRRVFRLKTLPSFLVAFAPLLLIFLFRIPLLDFAYKFTKQLDLTSLSKNLLRLLQMFQGTEIASGNRLGHYANAWQSFLESPFFGSIFSGEKALSQHSELLDLLSGVGIVGTTIFALMFSTLQHGLWKAVKKSVFLPHLLLMAVALLALSCFGTSFYSRDVYLIYACSLLLAAKTAPVTPSAAPGEGSTDTLPKANEEQ